MNYHQMDVNKQIKEKLMLFQEIDKNAKAKANPLYMKNDIIENTDKKENPSKNIYDNKLKNLNPPENKNDKNNPIEKSEFNKYNSFNKKDFASNESNSLLKSTNLLSGNGYNTNNSKNEVEKIKNSKDFSVAFNTNNIDAKKFLTNNIYNNETNNKNNYKKINLEKNLLLFNNKQRESKTKSKSKSKGITENKTNSKTPKKGNINNIKKENSVNNNTNNNKNNEKNKLNKSNNSINKGDPNLNLSASPVRSILKNGSREKLKNSSSLRSYNDDKFIPINESNSVNCEFLKKNKHIIFNDIENKIVSNNNTNQINNINNNNNCNNNNNKNKSKNEFVDYNKEFEIKDNDLTNKSKLENVDKSNISNFFSHHESPIRKLKSPDLSSSFLVEGDGMSNIMLNKEKNLNIINLDRLYQGSFNKEFCELYANTNMIQNESTMNKTNQNSVFNNTNLKKSLSDLKTTNYKISGNNFKNNTIDVINDNKTNFNNNIYKKTNNNSNVPIQELNKFFTKRANYNNLNYFTSKKPDNSKSREYYSTNEKNKNIIIDGAPDNQINSSSKKSFNINLMPAYSNSNQKSLENSNKKDLYTFNNQNPEENLRNPTFNNNNENNNIFNNKNLQNPEEENCENNFEESYFKKLNSKSKSQILNISNNSNNNICNYVDYNSPFINQKEGDPKYVEKLSNYHFIYKNKIEKMRKEEFDKRYKSANPQITQKAKNIVREGHLFHCRLYPYHKIPKNTVYKKPNYTIRNTYYNHNHNNININNIFYYNSANNSNSASYIIENLRRLEGIEDIKTYKIYRTSKNQDYLNLSNSVNENKGMNNSFNNFHRTNNNLNSSLRSSISDNGLNYNSTIGMNNMSKSVNLNNNNNNISNQLNRSFNDLIYNNNNNNPFTFKPKLNNKSLQLAEKLTPAYLRLTEKTRKPKKNHDFVNNEINPNNNNINDNENSQNNNLDNLGINPNHSYDAILLGKGLSENSKINKNIRSNSKGEFNRSFELYRRGVQRLKKKKMLHTQKIINEEESYKQFPFKPQINENFPAILLAAKAYKMENIENPNDQISNVHNINYGIYLNKNTFKKNEKNERKDKNLNLNNNNNSANANLINSSKEKNSLLNTNQVANIYYNKFFPEGYFSNKSENNDNNSNNLNVIRNNSISFYDKNIYWKQNLQKKFNRLKDEKEEEYKNIHTFKPEIHKVPVGSDEKFIERNINQIQEYVNKRRSYLQKSREEMNYKNSKYHFGENFKIKTTIPKEFNLSYKASQEKILSKSASSFYRGNDNKENLNAFDKKNLNSRSNSRDPFNLNVKYKNKNKKIDVQNLRQNYKINDFFEFDEVITADSAKENNETKNKNVKKSGNLFSKNSNLLMKPLNKSFNNHPTKGSTNKNKSESENEKTNKNHNIHNNENFQTETYGCEINTSDQTHNMPKDNFYHNNNLNNFSMNNNQKYNTNSQHNINSNNYYVNNSINFQNPLQYEGNSFSDLTMRNYDNKPNHNQYSNNIQVNNFFLDKSDLNFTNQPNKQK